MSNKYKYVVTIDGGRGPDVWEETIAVEGDDILSALREAMRIARDWSGSVTGIEQDDHTELPIRKYVPMLDLAVATETDIS